MMFPKEVADKDRKYTAWVKTLPCCVCFAPADDPHHLQGHGTGKMGGKVSDYWTMPMCRTCHDEFHRLSCSPFEDKYGTSQWEFVRNTLLTAIDIGFIKPVREHNWQELMSIGMEDSRGTVNRIVAAIRSGELLRC